MRFFFLNCVIMNTIFSLIYFQQRFLNKMGVAEFSPSDFHDFLSFSLQNKNRLKAMIEMNQGRNNTFIIINCD